MGNFKMEMEQQLNTLDKLIEISNSNLNKMNKIPAEYLCTSGSAGNFQYYHKDPATKKRKYISKKDLAKIRDIIQKEYEMKVNRTLYQQRKRLDSFIRNYDINSITDIYESIGKAKQCLINPIIAPTEIFIKQWHEEYSPAQNSYPMKFSFDTDNGEIVRSKSEKIIADALLKRNIPYSYEPRLSFHQSISKCPDFAVLNVRTRKTWFWEHLGRLSEAEYAIDAFDKLILYERNGIVLGQNLIITMETKEIPLDIKQIQKLIEYYLV